MFYILKNCFNTFISTPHRSMCLVKATTYIGQLGSMYFNYDDCKLDWQNCNDFSCHWCACNNQQPCLMLLMVMHLGYGYRCDNMQTAFDVSTVATSRLAWHWMCNSPQKGCVRRITSIYMWREQAIKEWSRWVISVVPCCHSVKLWALAAQAFWLQHYKFHSNFRQLQQATR